MDKSPVLVDLGTSSVPVSGSMKPRNGKFLSDGNPLGRRILVEQNLSMSFLVPQLMSARGPLLQMRSQ
jgi:hypothetical protein